MSFRSLTLKFSASYEPSTALQRSRSLLTAAKRKLKCFWSRGKGQGSLCREVLEGRVDAENAFKDRQGKAGLTDDAKMN